MQMDWEWMCMTEDYIKDEQGAALVWLVVEVIGLVGGATAGRRPAVPLLFFLVPASQLQAVYLSRDHSAAMTWRRSVV
jgi:hypothetical protein